MLKVIEFYFFLEAPILMGNTYNDFDIQGKSGCLGGLHQRSHCFKLPYFFVVN